MEKNWKFGRGIYGSKDAPIKLLDKMIAGIVILILALSIAFALNGGYLVSFETGEADLIVENEIVRDASDGNVPEGNTSAENASGNNMASNQSATDFRFIEPQKLRYGQLVQEPEKPKRPGYEFVTWVTSKDETLAEEWNFAEDRVEGDMTLYAVWKKMTE